MANETNTESTPQLLQNTNWWLEKMVDELQKVDHTGNAALKDSINNLSRELQLKLDKVAQSVDVKPTFRPAITVQSPEVRVDAADLRPLEKIFTTEVPQISRGLREAIAELPSTDLGSIETSLEKLLTITEQVRDKRVPLPSFPTTLKVVNVDGSPVGESNSPGTLISFITAVTTAGTRVQLANHAAQGIVLEAPSTNTGKIYVGSTTVSSAVFGAELQAGQSVGVAVNNTNLIYIDASVNGDKCSVIGS